MPAGTIRRTVLTQVVLTAALGCGTSASSGSSGSSGGPSGASAPAATKAGPATALPVAKLAIGLVGGISDAGFYVANDKGYFREQGIEVDIQRFSTASAMVAPLGTGELHVGGGAAGAGLLNAVARGIPVRIVADKGSLVTGHGFEALLLRKDLAATVRGASDLKGRTVALSSRDISAEVTLDTYLRTGGLTVDDVKVVTMAHADMVVAFTNSAIDVGVVIEPYLTLGVSRGVAGVLKRSDEITPGHQTAVVLFGPQLAAEQVDVARRFTLAYLKGVRDYNDAFDKKIAAKRREVVEVLIQNTPVKEPDLYEQMVYPALDPNGRVNLDSLMHQQDWFLAKGTQQMKVDLAKLADPSFTTWAVQQLGTYR